MEVAFTQLLTSHNEIGSLWCQFKDKSKDVKQILLDLANNTPKDALVAGNTNSKEFLESINASITKHGASWVDVIIHFQWRAIRDQMLNGSSD